MLIGYNKITVLKNIFFTNKLGDIVPHTKQLFLNISQQKLLLK